MFILQKKTKKKKTRFYETPDIQVGMLNAERRVFNRVGL